MDSSDSGQVPIVGSSETDNKLSNLIKVEGFLDHQKNCQLLNKGTSSFCLFHTLFISIIPDLPSLSSIVQLFFISRLIFSPL
jgi:hypothetical protein